MAVERNKYSMQAIIRYNGRLVDVLDRIRAIRLVLMVHIEQDLGPDKELVTIKVMTPYPARETFHAIRKMSLGKKTMCIVEFTDLFGKKHMIKCSNRKQMLDAQQFLGMFKSESVKVKNILAEYPISFGKIPMKFMKELRTELKQFGFSYSFINKLAGH